MKIMFSAPAFILRTKMMNIDSEYATKSMIIKLCSREDCDMRLPLLKQLQEYERQTNTSFGKKLQM